VLRANVPVTVIDRLLDPNILTIGFARRFATYKRGTLLLRDPERLKRLVNSTDRPIQFVFSGKAHPADEEGKNLIQAISQFTRDASVRERMVFLDNYDMEIARHLVQGVDVWLNTPRRPHEASGTSGMKAAANGVPNLSILDGWWVEAYAAAPDAGWAIGDGESLPDDNAQDRLEADSLYDLLEHSVAPAFYERDAKGLPQGWLKKMRACFTQVAPVFSTQRMVSEYADRLYAPAITRGRALAADRFKPAALLAHEKDRVRWAWDGVSIQSVHVGDGTQRVGNVVMAEAIVNLGTLKPADVRVEMLFEPGESDCAKVLMTPLDPDAAGPLTYSAKINCGNPGLRRIGVRVIPAIANLATPFEPGLIRWA
jgi:starch phosphorylase